MITHSGSVIFVVIRLEMKYSIRALLVTTTTFALAGAGYVAYQQRAEYLDRQRDGVNAQRLQGVLSKLDENNVESDVETRIESGDFRYAAVFGLGIRFPGLPEREMPIATLNENHWTMNGTSDLWESSHHREMVERAWRYARRYNELMFERRAQSN